LAGGWSEVELISLIGEFSTQSGEFRCRWAAHDVRFHRTGRKRLA
jgi:transcription regulator MmyB-like protein